MDTIEGPWIETVKYNRDPFKMVTAADIERIQENSGQNLYNPAMYIQDAQLLHKYSDIIFKRYMKEPVVETIDEDYCRLLNSRIHNRPPTSGYVCRKCHQDTHWTDQCQRKNAPPTGYVCRKCGIPNHWIQECKGMVDAWGNVPPQGIRRPVGIPKSHLVRVQPGTPNCYLGYDGLYYQRRA